MKNTHNHFNNEIKRKTKTILRQECSMSNKYMYLNFNTYKIKLWIKLLIKI